VLPPESTRLLDVQGRIRDRFELFGFREVLTPALEYSEVIEEHGLRDVSYKLFDQDNQMLLLRPEMTTPIARLISQRLAGSPPPHKLSYVLPAYRRASVGRGQSAELYQAGVEVVGSASPREDASTIALLDHLRVLQRGREDLPKPEQFEPIPDQILHFEQPCGLGRQHVARARCGGELSRRLTIHKRGYLNLWAKPWRPRQSDRYDSQNYCPFSAARQLAAAQLLSFLRRLARVAGGLLGS
jgi:hypothetical protein